MANAALAMMFRFQGEKEKGEKEKKSGYQVSWTNNLTKGIDRYGAYFAGAY